MERVLAAFEKARLGELEAVVERGLATFIEVGQALQEIRDSRLYRASFATFEDYCRGRWGFDRAHGYRLMQSAEVVAALSPIGDTPRNEAQARELAPVLRDEGEAAVVAVWRELRARYGDEVTAERVRRLVERRIERVERERGRVARIAATAGDHVFGEIRVRSGDFRSALADVAGVADAIIADPPYDRGWVDRDGDDFGAAAARMLKPTGTLVVMFGQLNQYVLQPLLARHLRHRWTGAYLTPGWHGRMFGPRVATGWKPLLLYTRRDAPAPEFLVDDVFVSEQRDKAHHDWGQSESGIGRLVEAFSRPGELVVDPFLGGGTTAVVCRNLGRRFIGCDVDERAIEISRRRLAA